MLIHRWDESLDEHEWRTFLAEHRFGDLVASGRNRDLAVVVPTQFVLDGDEVVIHLARPNPIWAAIDENDQVMVCVAADWAFIPSSWKAVGDEDPRLGIPTTYNASVQLVGTARIIDDVDEEHRVAVAARLRDRDGPGDAAALAHLRRRINGGPH